MNPPSPKPKVRSLADYLIRYDLATMLEEAQQDYNLSTSGGPRHLDQKDIAARFQKARGAPKAPHE